MNILFVASEAAPLIKVGGLADVVGALPSALSALGHDVRVMLPKYSVITADRAPEKRIVVETVVLWRGQQVPVKVIESTLLPTATTLYLLETPTLFEGDAIYYEHNGPEGIRLAEERYTFFSWAAAHCATLLNWPINVIHCHDWHTGLLPALLAVKKVRLPTMLTIHNMESQGRWRAEEVFSWLGLTGHEVPGLEFRDVDNNLNALQSGIRTATVVTTVSPQYAIEVLSPLYGAGLERDIQSRPDGMRGIVNGIDVAVFNPETDSRIPAQYSASTAVVGKLINKRALRKELGLPDSDGPLFGLVGRLTSQKGVDLVASVIGDIVNAGGQVVILGSGVPEVEELVVSATKAFPSACKTILRFDAALAQRIYAASDFFLMPSRFEPCGLGQMIAMRYGAIPIVRDTGGLHDTVRDTSLHPDGTGFVFSDPIAGALRTTIVAALRLYHEHDKLQAVRTRDMTEDFSWARSASDYSNLYTYARKSYIET